MQKLTKTLSTLALLGLAATGAHAQLVISQVYGGGGNSGATYTNDFIELYNNGPVAINLSTYSIQYTSSAGTFSLTAPTGTATPLFTNLSGTIASGKFFLVQEAAGAGGTTALPTADLTGGIAISATSGKVALVSSQSTVASGPGGTSVVDFVGFGTANQSEGTAIAALTNTTAAFRKTLASGGVQDTNSNVSDFTVYTIDGTTTPGPRNSASPSVGTVAAPEPSSLVAMFLGAGALGLMATRRRRTMNAA